MTLVDFNPLTNFYWYNKNNDHTNMICHCISQLFWKLG